MTPTKLPQPMRLWRLSLLLATSLCGLPTLPAMAQSSPPAPAGNGEEAGQPDTNPPAVAGNLSSVAGAVSFHAAGETQWSPATINYPVTNGEGFWTEPQASATIDVANNRLVLDESTELDVATLDQSQFVVTAAQGALFIQLADMAQGQSMTVNTPRGSVQITQAGRYEIVAGDTNDATMVNVIDGAAHVSGNALSLDIGPQQSATITGTDTPQGSVGALQMDAFLKNQMELAQQTANVPQQCRNMTGARSLTSYGSFRQSAQYGQVWYPNNVSADWAPYRDGHWSYVAPWGWTWVDNAPWGFAPFHYGRWAEIDNRWGWIPGGGEAAEYGPDAYPVYSPALVTFVGIGAGVGIGLSVGAFEGGYAPAWIPLGPREPYYPWYHFREGYFSRVNAYYGVPRTIIDRGPTYINQVNFRQTNIFINRRYATVAPAQVFARGESIRQFGRPVPEHALVAAHPFGAALPVRPTAFTPNLPRSAAERFHVAAPARPLREAPGPRITPAAAGPHAMPELRHAPPPQNIRTIPASARGPGEPGRMEAAPRPGAPMRPGEAPRPAEAPRPSEPGRAGPPGIPPRPGETGAHGLPALRAPGARPDALAHPEAGVPHPGEAPHLGAPSRPGQATRPGAVERPGELARPSESARPGEPARQGQAARPGEPAHPGEAARPNEPGRPPQAETRPAPHNATARPEARPGAPAIHAGPQPGPAQEHRAEPARPAPRPEASRPAARAEPPRPSARSEPARPAPRPEAPRPTPHAEAQRPSPHPEAPRPEAPRSEAPRPQAPRPEAPRPGPAPHPEARPAPHPAAPPDRKHG